MSRDHPSVSEEQRQAYTLRCFLLGYMGGVSLCLSTLADRFLWEYGLQDVRTCNATIARTLLNRRALKCQFSGFCVLGLRFLVQWLILLIAGTYSLSI